VLVLALVLWGVPRAPAQDGPTRMAFVVGNAAHDGAAALPEAGRDAREIATVLERQGLEVSLLLNGDAATFAAAFESFARRAEGAALALVYFGGYGLRAGGEDYLLPIDLAPESAAAVRAGGIALDGLIARLATGNRPAVFLLDASHALALPGGAGLEAGLGAPVPGPESLIALAAQPGTLAPGGGRHAFSAALAESLAVEGQSLDRVLADLVESVRTRSGGQQVPWLASSLTTPAFLNPFVPDAEDFARLAAMSGQQRAFVIGIWRGQGARFGPEEEARLAALTEAAAQPAPPQFSFEFIEDVPPPTVLAEIGAAPAAPAGDAPPRLSARPDEPPARSALAPPGSAPEADAPAARPGPAPRGPSSALAAVSDPAMSEPAMSEPAMSDPAMSDPAMSEPAMSDPAVRDPAMSEPAMSDPVGSDPAPAPARRETVNLAAVAPAAPAGAAPPGIALTMLSARAVHSRPAIADQPIARIRSEAEPLLLASLGPARSLRPEPDMQPDRLIGRDVTEGYLVPEDLPRAVQTELARVGCYRAGVDGVWGNGSRSALQRYVDGNGSALSGLEPTEEVWRELRAVTGEVCAAPAPTPRAAQPAARPAPAAPRQAAPVARAPAPAPAAPAQDTGRLRRSLTSGLR
jgi:uncharacterized caspase-like protein